MISLTRIRDLDLAAPSSTGRPLYLSAASGLVRAQSFIYVVADDEFHLGVFPATGLEPGYLIRLFDGELPDDNADRKKRKPDLEALVRLPAFAGYPQGALLALGSGSKRKRRRGALLGLAADGAVGGAPRPVDLTPILEPLEGTFSGLNIEGAIVIGDELRLFQRGNKRQMRNAVIRFGLAAVVDTLNLGRSEAIEPLGIQPFELGQVGGIPLSFTDAAALPDGSVVFTAVAEDTADTYNDGPCAGAAVGIIGSDGDLRLLQPLDKPYKVEGIDARVDGDAITLLLVSDADDPATPAGLYSAALAR
jgi:uncharacterized protein DUF6929